MTHLDPSRGNTPDFPKPAVIPEPPAQTQTLEDIFVTLIKAMPISTFNRFIDLLGQERLLPPVAKAVAK